MEFVLATIERRRLLVPLPFGVMKAASRVPAVPAEAADHARSGRVAARPTTSCPTPPGATAARSKGLGIIPESIEAIVPTYLWRFRKTGQFQAHAA